MDGPQKILFLLGSLLLITACSLFFLDKNSAGWAAMTTGLVLSLASALGPSTIQSLMFKSANGSEMSIQRSTDTPEKLQAAIKVVKEANQGMIGDQSKKLFDEAEATPEAKRSAVDYLLLATEHWKSGDYLDGLTFAQQGLRLDPEDHHLKAALLNQMGILLSGMGDTTRAETFYKKAISVDARFAAAHNNFGNLLTDLKRAKEAEAAFRKAKALDPEIELKATC